MTLYHYFLCCLSLLLVAACEPVVLDPNDPLENPGPYKTATRFTAFISNTGDDNINGRFYYPQTNQASHSQALVVLMPGFSVSYRDYERYSLHLASHGIVVLAFDFLNTSSDSADGKHDDKAIQASEAIDHALTHNSIGSLINADKIAAMGHSLGGKIAFYAASQDERIKAVVALDPSNAGGPPCFISPNNCANYPVAPNPSRGHTGVLMHVQAASLIFRSRPDLTNPAEEFNASYFYFGDDGNGNNAVPEPAFYINMGDAAHASYVPTMPGFVPAISRRNALAWLQTVFNGTDNSSYFTGSKMQQDINAGRVVGYQSRGY